LVIKIIHDIIAIMTTKAQSKKNYSVSKDKTINFQLAISSTEINREYQKILKKTATNIEIKGFRKGRAPLDLVEKELSLSKIYEKIIQNLIPPIYTDFIVKNKLKPIIEPQINLANPPLSLEKDWNFNIKTCQQPDFNLKPYKTELKKINQKKYKNLTQHKQEILNLLTSKSTVNIPQILLDTQIRHRMSQLIDSLSQAGQTLDQYFKDRKISGQRYQQKLNHDLTNEWKINLSLDKIASDQKIEVKPEEIKKVLPPSQATTNQQTNYVHYLLKQQKTITYLQTLK